MRLAAILTAGLVFALPLTAAAADLVVDIVGLASNSGDVHVAVYDKAEAFPTSDGMLKETQVPVAGKRASARFTGLPTGKYAVAVYHDENGNDEFDQGFLGIPLEEYGFSNDAAVFFGPPSFDAAGFEVRAPETRIEIRLGPD